MAGGWRAARQVTGGDACPQPQPQGGHQTHSGRLGRHALAHFAPRAKIGEVHGTLLLERDRALFPMYHPAAALHANKLRETLIVDARELPILVNGGRIYDTPRDLRPGTRACEVH